MTDRDNYVAADRGGSAGRGTSTVAWIALILSLLALGLAWWAYNRTGADLTERIREETQQATQSVQQGTQEAVNEVQEGAQEAENAVDAGPDGIDEDDTETGGSTEQNTTPTPTPTPSQ